MQLTDLGSVSSIVMGLAVVKIDDPLNIPQLGSRAVHRNSGKVIGVVSDIIGPTSSPYAVIKLREGVSLSIGDRIACEARRKGGRV